MAKRIYPGQGHSKPDTALFTVGAEARIGLHNGAILFGTIARALDIRRNFSVLPWGCRHPLAFRLEDVRRSDVACSTRWVKFKAISERQRQELEGT